MSITISDEAKNILRPAGWYEGRHVDTKEVEAFLHDRGFSVPDIARDFLAEFSGLKLRLLNKGGLSFVHFDVHEEMSWIEEDDKPYLEALTQGPLCPVGHGGGVLLFLSPKGEMILLNDQWLGFSRIPTITEGIDLILGIRKSAHYDGISLRREQMPPGFR